MLGGHLGGTKSSLLVGEGRNQFGWRREEAQAVKLPRERLKGFAVWETWEGRGMFMGQGVWSHWEVGEQGSSKEAEEPGQRGKGRKGAQEHEGHCRVGGK